MMKTIVVGGVAGGMSAATRLRRLRSEAEIVVLERGAEVSYANCGLPYYAGGVIERRADLLLQTPQSLGDRFGLDVRVRSEATAIDREHRRVRVRDLATGREYEERYDHLVLSPGAVPVVPDLPGVERALLLRTVDDGDRLAAAVRGGARTAVVVGGGYIGLEVAENLTRRGLAVAVVERDTQVLASTLDPEMAAPVHTELAANDITLHLGVTVTKVLADAVELDTGRLVGADLVVLAVGVRPQTGLAAAAGLALGPRGGIAVDDAMRTSDPLIYAVGDAVEKTDRVTGRPALIPLANTANRQGRLVADAIAGRPVRLGGRTGTAIVQVFSRTVATTGANEKSLRAAGRPFLAIHTHPASHASYYPGAEPMSLKLLLDPADGTILGAQAVGGAGVDKRIDVIATALYAGLRADELADLELGYAPAFGSAKDPVNMLGYIAANQLCGDEPTVQWHEVDAAVDAGAVLLDVRTPAEYEAGHLPGAGNLPLDELRQRMDEVPNRDIIVYCQVGQRAHTAAALLTGHGHRVRNLDGGYLTWTAGRKSVEVS